MDWKTFWNQFGQYEDVHKQVARVSKDTMPLDIIPRIGAYLRDQLDLNTDDRLLDICCGNGVITHEMAAHCEQVFGIDLSSVQVDNARESATGNVTFLEGDALGLSSLVSGPFDKVLCYFSFQYFDTYQKGQKALSEMNKVLKPGGVIFLGDIPDYHRKDQFYQTWKAILKHQVDRLLDREAMGKFWKAEELDTITRDLGLKGSKVEQPDGMLYSHYRFDYRVEKPQE